MISLLSPYQQGELAPYTDALAPLIQEKQTFLANPKGNFKKYLQVVDQLPDLVPSVVRRNDPAVGAGAATDMSEPEHRRLKSLLKQLSPWRKGPFNLFGIHVDAEWRSDMKWDRVSPHLPDLTGRRVLDIGASNGYYMFRMASHDPALILGLEPQSAFFCQYLAVQKYVNQKTVACLPAAYEELPQMNGCFDLVFCMGILYHRRSPMDMLKEIHGCLKPSGTLVLENLVLEGNNHLCLFPEDRYAKMRNVYFIPDLSVMSSWLSRVGFKEIRCVDVSPTTLEEQRKTGWIQTESLSDFLDQDDPAKTVEGYPAPVRAVFMALA
ncbi:MAG: tRNA 5-methoxyuridine(34)/uridine 5-oxyacetic acid(34) synthase CmoB [Desulfotignum sp.]|nr:tRNA 5-methoxyuridine(34)/uridine 5-oxyacetic acid(34) synthase CmoB [Desulfotignum sp.]